MKKAMAAVVLSVLSFVFIGISYAQDITISADTVWQPGTYTYDNVLVTNGATLTFNGAVTLNAQNLTIDSISSVSANGTGFPAGQGPGAGNGAYQGSGAGYGGKGGSGYGVAGPTYGSSLTPVESGSGGGVSQIEYGNAQGGSGAGAIQLNIQNTLVLNGIVSANGGDGAKSSWKQGGGGSGGSVHIITNSLTGSGSITANGGRGDAGGGGGRIAVYYKASNFTGNTEARGGIGNNPAWNGEDGTSAFIDQQNNILYAGSFFRFQENDPSLNFTKVVLNNSKVTSQGNISLAAEELLLSNSAITLNDAANFIVSGVVTITNSSFSFTGAQSLNAPSVTLNNSTLLLSGNETLSLTNLTLNNNSVLAHAPQGKIALVLTSLAIDATSLISADAQGYPTRLGPGTGESNVHGRNGGGAGYGGKGGDGAIVGGWTAKGGVVYGVAAAPTNLGSGGGTIWNDLAGPGGGVVNLMIYDTLTLNGKITADGADGQSIVSMGEAFSGGGGSGGSIYIITSKLAGSGAISVNGGKGGGLGGGGGGGGGRAAVYYKTSALAGKVEAKGGTGCQNGEDGTIVFQPISLDTPVTTFNLFEKSSTTSTSQETLTTQQLNLNNLQITGDLTGTLNFTSLTLTTLSSGAFSGEGFLEAEFQTALEGASYQGNLQGVVYPVFSEHKIYLKGSISGLLISGIMEGYLTESVPGSGTYDKFQSIWKLNRLGTGILSATISLEGAISSQSSHSFTSSAYLYQANFEGDALGSYTGPLSAILTHLRLTGENEYKGRGFSLLSYNSLLGQGEGYSYNKVVSEGIVGLYGLFNDPLLGILQATLDETQSPKTLSGTIERLGLGAVPVPDLKVNVWGPARVSPGQTFDYVIELRNDGLRSAENFRVVDELPWQATHISNTGGGIYNDFSRRVIWNLGSLSAKSKKYFTVRSELEWGLSDGMVFGNLVTIPKEGIATETDPAVKINYELINASENHINASAVVSNQSSAIPLNIDLTVRPSVVKVEPNFEEIHESGNSTEYRGRFSVRDDRLFRGLYTVVEFLAREDVPSAQEMLGLLQAFEGSMESLDGFTADQLTLVKLNSAGKISDGLFKHLSGANDNKFIFVPLLHMMEAFSDHLTVDPAVLREVSAGIPEALYQRNFDTSVLAEYAHDALQRDELLNKKAQAGVLSSVSYAAGSQPGLAIAARDPNELLVSPAGNIKPGDMLTYTINYENEGEGDAYGVYVTDTLLENLDDTTLVINNGGKYNPGTRTITWFIGELPSKQKGSLTFSVNVNKDAPDKAEVINFATVYFPSVPETTRTNGTVNIITTFIDNVAPVTVILAAPPVNPAGWNNSDVTVNLSANDDEGGTGVKEIHYTLSGAVTGTKVITGDVAQILVSAEGKTTLTYYSLDNAGNAEAPQSLEVKIDKTPPGITADVSPQANSRGWNNTDVAVVFTGNDNLSGVASVTGPSAVTTEGKDQIIGGEAIDLAGNRAAASVTLNIDKTAPEAKIYFNKDSKTLKVEGVDNLSLPAVIQQGNVFTVSDKADNILKLNFKELKQHGKEIKAELASLQYGARPVIQLPETGLKYEWSLDKKADTAKELEQEIEVEGQVEVKAKYNHEKNETKIKIERRGEKESEQRFPGLIIIKLATNSGLLDVSRQ